jgi:hypothetical protein
VNELGWRLGEMKEGWRDEGGMEGWGLGGMEGWTDGGMEGWRDGGMEGWRDGGRMDIGRSGCRDVGQEDVVVFSGISILYTVIIFCNDLK